VSLCENALRAAEGCTYDFFGGRRGFVFGEVGLFVERMLQDFVEPVERLVVALVASLDYLFDAVVAWNENGVGTPHSRDRFGVVDIFQTRSPVA
jgi:hypothetical protein